MQYNGIALSESFKNGRISGQLEIENDQLLFKANEEIIHTMPIDGIAIQIGGAANRYLFFNHSHSAGITLYTDQKTILQDPAFAAHPELKPILQNLLRKRTSLWTSAMIITGIVIAMVIGLWLMKDKMVENIANTIPPSQEQKISEQMRKSALLDKHIITDSLINQKIKLITQPLVKAVNDTQFKFSFTVIEDESLNAFALPGGAVIIHSGLLEKAQSAEEVAGVLAHEISHVTKRHHLRGIISNFGLFFILRGLVGDIAGISADIATAGAALSSLKYSRDYEREADDNGFKLLQKANIPTQGMIDFFYTMSKEAPDLGDASFLSTHPATKERIDNLKAMPAKKDSHALAIDYKDFKAHLKNVLNQSK
jgi:predicted Zn-dependent protease